MTDMLVRLYDIPEMGGYAEEMERIGVLIRRPNVWEKPLLLDWVNEHFNLSWTLECEVAFTTRPPACFIAVKDAAPDRLCLLRLHAPEFFRPDRCGGTCQRKRGGIDVAVVLPAQHERQGICLCHYRRCRSVQFLRPNRRRYDHRGLVSGDLRLQPHR